MKTAVVLMNLGGPDSLDAVKPFLFSLFNDKAIISVPQPLRYLIAKIISGKRAKIAKGIYEQLGGSSPILRETKAQARALEHELASKGEFRVFIAMRHWHPKTEATVQDVKDYAPDKVILLPLYPQYSTTTTQSSFDKWYQCAKRVGLNVPHTPICCYPFDQHFIKAQAELIQPAYEAAKQHGTPRILFSAHGLPKKVIDKGDPYQSQVEKTVAAILRVIGNVDSVTCYQSRVGPLEWIGPSTETEIARAGKDGVPVVVVPVAFVSEHSETLVELDVEYAHLAKEHGVPYYGRVPTVSTHPEFITSLAWLCEATHFFPNCSNSLGRICAKEFKQCGFREWK